MGSFKENCSSSLVCMEMPGWTHPNVDSGHPQIVGIAGTFYYNLFPLSWEFGPSAMSSLLFYNGNNFISQSYKDATANRWMKRSEMLYSAEMLASVPSLGDLGLARKAMRQKGKYKEPEEWRSTVWDGNVAGSAFKTLLGRKDLKLLGSQNRNEALRTSYKA